MPTPHRNEIDDDRCQCLRWNGLFTASPLEDTSMKGQGRAYWCQRTQHALGPDGKTVDEYECNPFRACYEEL